MAEKKKCPYCDREIAKAGWKMHYANKHIERKYVPFDQVGGKGGSVSGDESFRGGEEGRREKPKREKRETKEERREENHKREEDDGWGTVLDD